MKAVGEKRAKIAAVPKRPAPERPKLRVVPPSSQPAVLEFQTDAIELEQRRPPPLARMTLYAVVVCIGCAIWWASVSNIDEIVVAPGKLTTTEPALVVQVPRGAGQPETPLPSRAGYDWIAPAGRAIASARPAIIPALNFNRALSISITRENRSCGLRLSDRAISA